MHTCAKQSLAMLQQIVSVQRIMNNAFWKKKYIWEFPGFYPIFSIKTLRKELGAVYCLPPLLLPTQDADHQFSLGTPRVCWEHYETVIHNLKGNPSSFFTSKLTVFSSSGNPSHPLLFFNMELCHRNGFPQSLIFDWRTNSGHGTSESCFFPLLFLIRTIIRCCKKKKKNSLQHFLGALEYAVTNGVLRFTVVLMACNTSFNELITAECKDEAAFILYVILYIIFRVDIYNHGGCYFTYHLQTISA